MLLFGLLQVVESSQKRIYLKPHIHHKERKKNGSGPIKKLVRTRYFCRVNLPYNVFMKWMRTPFFLYSRLWPQNRKKKPDRTPFAVRKMCKRIFVPYHLLHVSLPCFAVVSPMCSIALLIISLT